jgi:adenylosuccinate synthase
LLDVTKGYVPYVTSSLTGAGAAYSGGDLSPHHHRKTIGVAKVLMSRVGHGPFVSEFGGTESEAYCMAKKPDGSSMHNRDSEKQYDIDALIRSENPLEVGQALRVLSAEYGTVSARPRRVGSLDLPLLKMTAQLNGVDELFLTKCDLLREYSRTAQGRIPVTVGYELNGEVIDYVPSTTETYSKVRPIVEYWDAFADDVSKVRSSAGLPHALREFLNKVGEFTGSHIFGVGVGPQRDQVVVL